MKLVKVVGVALALGLVVGLATSAAAQDVKTDFDKAYNFGAVKTFSIRLGQTWGNDLSQRRVLDEFDGAIAAKGWKKVPEGQGDIVVILNGATETKHSASTFYTGMGGGYGGYHYGGMGMGSSQTVVSEYTVGTLVVDMFDTKTKTLVFRGTASDELSDKPDKNVKKLEKASDKMLKNFPPKPDAKK